MTRLGQDLIQAANEAREMIWNEDLDILKYKLKNLLKDNIMIVSFTKMDGTLREMKCSLKPTLIPDSAFLTADEKERSHTVPENVLPVWDLDKNAWRSFRIDRVHDYIIIKNEAKKTFNVDVSTLTADELLTVIQELLYQYRSKQER